MIVMFFLFYVLSFVSKGWIVYFWTSLQILISITMSLLFGYVYFSLFLAFFIGNIKNKAGFFTLYSIHLVTTLITVNYGLLTRNPFFITQLPFVLVSVAGVILLPVTTYNRNKNDQLQDQLEHANKRISELVKLEERQRISRDLHDTLGQKLSLIGLKSDLAGKLISRDPTRAQSEINDVRQTARTALKEVREMVTRMRGTRLTDEIFRIEQILKVAEIDFAFEGTTEPDKLTLMNENVISMCLKEAVNNIVKHSNASACHITVESTETDLVTTVKDNGIGVSSDRLNRGNGLQGMRERLEFVNGSLEIRSGEGTTLIIRVPNALRHPDKEAGL